MGAVVALVGWVLLAQAGTDQRQDTAIAAVGFESKRSDDRQDEALTKISGDLADTAESLREVATTLRLIDERGTQASLLRDRRD
jgi:hypothetical protein